MTDLDFFIEVIFYFRIVDVGAADDFAPKDIHDPFHNQENPPVTVVNIRIRLTFFFALLRVTFTDSLGGSKRNMWRWKQEIEET